MASIPSAGRQIFWLGRLLALTLLITACQPNQATWLPPQKTDTIPLPSSTSEAAFPFLPTFTVAPGERHLPGTPTPASATLACSNDLRYVEDLTIPDGTTVSAGETIDKQWLVANQGSCNWDENYRLKLVAGEALGANPEQALFPARAGSEAVIRMMFVAPTESGVQRSAWQAFDPQGAPFGDSLFIEILVSAP